MYIAILGRQPALGAAELERTYGSDAVRWFSDQSATISSSNFSLEHFGGTQKAGKIMLQLSGGDWRRVSMKIVQTYTKEWAHAAGKLTLGISAYGFNDSPRDIQKTGIILKQKLKQSGVSLRLLPNTDTALNTATSHHNHLGLSDNKKELLVVRARDGKIIIAESIGAQNITAYALRDQKRPKRDAFVGMLPPKLAQIMINLAGNMSERQSEQPPRLLDPFCGTGVILQEAALMGYHVYGTDLSEKMIDYSRANLDWLSESHHITVSAKLHLGDAMETTWQQPVDAVVCESYLGQPFSAPPSPAKLTEVRKNCNHIITDFLKNIAHQLKSGTPLCVAVPAWRDNSGNITHLPLVNELERLGFTPVPFKTVQPGDLLYYREDQIVAREL
ncbi:MAG TPA: methyltransferase domain-containing protein, partial [Candidatus Saccharimonadales bacterium]